MPKYWGKQIFAHGRFQEVGQKQKKEREKRRRAKLVNNNGQLCIATPPRVAHAKSPGPILLFYAYWVHVYNVIIVWCNGHSVQSCTWDVQFCIK